MAKAKAKKSEAKKTAGKTAKTGSKKAAKATKKPAAKKNVVKADKKSAKAQSKAAAAKKTDAKQSKPKVAKKKTDSSEDKKFVYVSYVMVIFGIIGLMTALLFYATEKYDYMWALIIGIVLGLGTIIVWGLAPNNKTKSIYAVALMIGLGWFFMGIYGIIFASSWEFNIYAGIGILYIVLILLGTVRSNFGIKQ